MWHWPCRQQSIFTRQLQLDTSSSSTRRAASGAAGPARRNAARRNGTKRQRSRTTPILTHAHCLYSLPRNPRSLFCIPFKENLYFSRPAIIRAAGRNRPGDDMTPSFSSSLPILVTGAAGFIGARFVESCNERSVPVVSVDHLAAFDSRGEHRGLDFGTQLD